MNEKKLMNRAADNIRILAASMVEKANSGHPGGAMGGADFVNVLFSEFLVYDPENPRWEGRILKIRVGKDVTVSSLIQATCHRCYIPLWH